MFSSSLARGGDNRIFYSSVVENGEEFFFLLGGCRLKVEGYSEVKYHHDCHYHHDGCLTWSLTLKPLGGFLIVDYYCTYCI